MVDNVKLGLGKADGSMDSGFRLVGYKWIFAEGSFVSHDIEPTWDLDDISWVVDKSMSGERLGCLLIQCSPFMAKNGRLLKEGDRVKYHGRYNGIVEYDKCDWRVLFDGMVDDVRFPLLQYYQDDSLEYIGNIYLRDGE